MGLFDFIEDEGMRIKAQEAYDAQFQTALEKTVDKKVEAEVAGLKNKNQELLDEKKKIANTLKNFEDIDPEKAREALQFLEENENARLLKEGKVDELLAKQTSSLKESYEGKISELSKKLSEGESAAEIYKKQYESKVVDDAVRDAAIKAGVRPEALNDVLIHGARTFSLNQEDGSVEARDSKGALIKLKDDIVMTPENWIEGLKSKSPHYWPPSEGAGGFGASFSGEQADLLEAMETAANKGDMVSYRRLRKKYNAKK